jgi:hypothetical protein
MSANDDAWSSKAAAYGLRDADELRRRIWASVAPVFPQLCAFKNQLETSRKVDMVVGEVRTDDVDVELREREEESTTVRASEVPAASVLVDDRVVVTSDVVAGSNVRDEFDSGAECEWSPRHAVVSTPEHRPGELFFALRLLP